MVGLSAPPLFPLLIFALTVFLVFKHPLLRLPLTSRYFHLDYGWAPLLGVLLLFLTRYADLDTAVRGVVGGEGLHPYSILFLILSLSYLCVSLDYRGLFEYLSLRITRLSGGSGRKLFFLFFLLTSFLTLFTDNDIVILTMTLLIFYMARRSGADPLPFLFCQFFTVNTLGMALYIGNPTNIVAADPAGLSFVEFARWMLLPSLAGAFAGFGLLCLLFRRRIPTRVEPPELDPRSVLKSGKGLWVGLAALVGAIVFMSLPPGVRRIPMWSGVALLALLVFASDLLSYGRKVPPLFRVPWKLAPFLVGLFVQMEVLSSSGWTDLLAPRLSSLGGLLPTLFLLTLFSSLLAGAMNNHPMTLFLVRTFQSPEFSAGGDLRLASTLGLIAGSNLGANLFLTGALAGLMWAKLLSDKGHPVSFSQFSRYGFAVTLPVMGLISLLLWVELSLWG
ncbi:MAG: ArsB/NhaD family transporter [Candidatus Hadarchaeales archaeon]